jgi:hypothetical protein
VDEITLAMKSGFAGLKLDRFDVISPKQKLHRGITTI